MRKAYLLGAAMLTASMGICGILATPSAYADEGDPAGVPMPLAATTYTTNFTVHFDGSATDGYGVPLNRTLDDVKNRTESSSTSRWSSYDKSTDIDTIGEVIDDLLATSGGYYLTNSVSTTSGEKVGYEVVGVYTDPDFTTPINPTDPIDTTGDSAYFVKYRFYYWVSIFNECYLPGTDLNDTTSATNGWEGVRNVTLRGNYTSPITYRSLNMAEATKVPGCTFSGTWYSDRLSGTVLNLDSNVKYSAVVVGASFGITDYFELDESGDGTPKVPDTGFLDSEAGTAIVRGIGAIGIGLGAAAVAVGTTLAYRYSKRVKFNKVK